jgi:arylsulfatase A-like enzyme/Flp pilus assembly protein TadD
VAARSTASFIVTALCLVCACKKAEQTPAPVRQPNVVVITVDTLRADRLGCYGFEPARTPNADALAARGVRAEHAIAAAPITLPSHASIFTGLYPPAHGVRDNGMYRLPEKVETLAERLKAGGYRTQAFVSADVLHHRFNLDQGFDAYDDALQGEDDPGMFRILERSGEHTMDRVLQWLDRSLVPSPTQAPFFVWVHLFDPHQPYAPPEADAKASRTLYDGEIASVDRQIGRFIAKLEERAALDDTIVVFTSDHGESLGEHGEATHAMFIYEATVRVPLIIRYPAKLPAGATYRGSVRAVDLMPTILGLVDLKPSDTQGVDLSKALAGAAVAPALSPYSESLHSELEFGMAPLHGIRSNDWTYIRAPRPELYDRAKDPGETRNLLEDASAPGSQTARDRALTMDKQLVDVFEDSKRFGLVSELEPLDEETTQMLQALGYMGDSDAPQGMEGMDPKDGVRAFDELDQARQLAIGGDYESAKKVLHALLKRVPRNASARNLLAMCELRTGNTEGVEELYLQSLAYEPRQPEVLVQLGRLELQEGKLDAARARFQEALNVEPADIPAMMLLAHIELRENRPEAAKSWYDKAIAADPNDSAPYLQYGDFYFRQNELQEARRWYDKALERQPDSFVAALQAGTSALRTGDLQSAQRYSLRASQIDPASWKPLYNLACVQVHQGDPNAAISSLQSAVARGFSDAALLQGDACFAPLHSDPRFRQLAQ